MGIFNWQHLPEDDSNQDEVKVSECAACGEDLMAGEEVVSDHTTELYFCDMGCAHSFVRANPDIYGKGADATDLDMKLVTLEAPDDHWSEEDLRGEDECDVD